MLISTPWSLFMLKVSFHVYPNKIPMITPKMTENTSMINRDNFLFFWEGGGGGRRVVGGGGTACI